MNIVFFARPITGELLLEQCSELLHLEQKDLEPQEAKTTQETQPAEKY